MRTEELTGGGQQHVLPSYHSQSRDAHGGAHTATGGGLHIAAGQQAHSDQCQNIVFLVTVSRLLAGGLRIAAGAQCHIVFLVTYR